MTAEERASKVWGEMFDPDGDLYEGIQDPDVVGAITQAIQAAVEEEREACAQLASLHCDNDPGDGLLPCAAHGETAAAIRSRGEKPDE